MEGEEGEDHPPSHPMQSSSPPRAQVEPARFPGELRVPLITENTNFNERLRRPRRCYCGQCATAEPRWVFLYLILIQSVSLSSTQSNSQNTPSLSDQSPLAGVHRFSFQYFLFNDALLLASRTLVLLTCRITMKGGRGRCIGFILCCLSMFFFV